MEQAKKFGTLGLATGVHYGETQQVLVPNAAEELLGLHASGALLPWRWSLWTGTHAGSVPTWSERWASVRSPPSSAPVIT
jgi:hypothetical protein